MFRSLQSHACRSLRPSRHRGWGSDERVQWKPLSFLLRILRKFGLNISLKMHRSFLFLPDCDSFSSDCLLPNTYHLHFESNHWPSRYGRSPLLNSFVLMSLESTVKSIFNKLQALCSQFVEGSTATCMEATPG